MDTLWKFSCSFLDCLPQLNSLLKLGKSQGIVFILRLLPYFLDCLSFDFFWLWRSSKILLAVHLSYPQGFLIIPQIVRFPWISFKTCSSFEYIWVYTLLSKSLLTLPDLYFLDSTVLPLSWSQNFHIQIYFILSWICLLSKL